MIELLNCDCMEYMATVPDKYFDLAIADPPYGLGMKNFDSSKNRINSKTHSRKNWDRQTPQSCYFDELFRISKNQIVWGANHFISKFALDSSCWLVWDKDNGESDYSDCELAWCSFSSPVRKFKYRWAGMLQENMKNKELRIHPTQKPVALYNWLLTNYAKKGQKILDTHLCSGSSAIAAHYFGVDFVGCELDKDYFEAAKARFDMATKQLAMSI